jgi:pyruvate-ferredoxin/flavodoxin oxidoreductase
VDVVLSPDPNVFKHTNALAGLKKGGVFIIQSEKKRPEEVWADIPRPYQKVIIDNDIRLFYIDGFKIAREEATDPELQLHMQGIAFQGAFFAASPLMKKSGLSEPALLKAIEDQLQHKFGAKGQRVVNDNMRVVKRGFDEVHEVIQKTLGKEAEAAQNGHAKVPIPSILKRTPQSESRLSDIHRFWEQTGSFYLRGNGSDNLTDPFIGLSVMPSTTALFRDMTSIRFEHPEWIPNNCTACGDCYTACPDTAIPGLVSELSDVLNTVTEWVRKKHGKLNHLPKAVRQMESRVREGFPDVGNGTTVNVVIQETIDHMLDEQPELAEEFGWFREELGEFKFALTRPYFDLPEKQESGSGGLFSITINPTTCKGCMECIEVCPDDALRAVPQTETSIDRLRREWDLWTDLPNTPDKYKRVDDLEEKIGPLETILLNKDAYQSFASGDGACLGCSEKSVIHLFTATVESLMQPRIKKHVAKLEGLIQKLEQHIREQLMGPVDLSDADLMNRILSESGQTDLTVSGIAGKMESARGSEPIDQDWLREMTQLLARLKKLKWTYTQGTTGQGRATMGMCNATGCTSVWGSTWPYNPYPFPWANHLFQDSPSMAMGIFEGHMAKMAEGFRAIRKAELELEGRYDPREHEDFFRYFNWKEFTEEEWLLCPPVVVLGGDGAMYDIGFQNLSRLMASGKPIKVIVVDTQVYSNTGGQACTSGFIGQVSDMAEFGKVWKGKPEPRKEIGLIAMAHRNTYVLQASLAHTSQMIEGFIDGLMTQRPALFNLYTTCQPEHGVGDDLGVHQAKLALESRAYPIFKYNPDRGVRPEEAFDLEGNPALHETWFTYKLKYLEYGREKTMEVAMTFADFALTEGRFRKHFRKVPRDAWNENMVQLADFLELEEAEREGKFPYIWATDRKQQLNRVLVDKTIVESCEERRDFWIMLRALAGVKPPEEKTEDLESKIRSEIVSNISRGLMKLAGGDGSELMELATDAPAGQEPAAGAEPEPAGDYLAPWLETEECTACDECIKLNPGMFAYNENGKAYIKDPKAGPYQDLVRAAEKCSARVIHPGLPADRSEKDIEKWIERGEKFN